MVVFLPRTATLDDIPMDENFAMPSGVRMPSATPMAAGWPGDARGAHPTRAMLRDETAGRGLRKGAVPHVIDRGVPPAGRGDFGMGRPPPRRSADEALARSADGHDLQSIVWRAEEEHRRARALSHPPSAMGSLAHARAQRSPALASDTCGIARRLAEPLQPGYQEGRFAAHGLRGNAAVVSPAAQRPVSAQRQANHTAAAHSFFLQGRALEAKPTKKFTREFFRPQLPPLN